MMRCLLAILAVVLLLGGPLRTAFAHDAHYSSVTLRLEADGLRIGMTLSTVALNASGERIPDALTIEKAVFPSLSLTVDGQRLPLHVTTVQVIPEKRTVLAEARAEWAGLPRSLRLHRLFPNDPEARTTITLHEQGRLQAQTILDRGKEELDYRIGSSDGLPVEGGRDFRRVMGVGIRAVLLEPVVLLFLLGLLLPGGAVRQFVRIFVAILLAYGITFTLSAFHVAVPSVGVIDPLMALSVVCVGADILAIRSGDRDLRVWLAFGFGLLCGFGSANALRVSELSPVTGWALVAFSLGVAIGLMAIVLVAASLFAWVLSRSPSNYRRVAISGAVGMVVIGAYLFAACVLIG